MALTRRCPASLAGRRALAPRIWGGRAHSLIGYPGLRPTSPRTPGRGPARPFHGPLRETRNGHTPVTSQYSVHLDESLSVRSKFIWHEGEFCFTLKSIPAQFVSTPMLTCAASDRAPKKLRPALHAARAEAATSRDDVVGARLVARIARIRTRHTAGAHAPMNSPNEHPHGCHTSAHPIPSVARRCCPRLTTLHTHFFLGGVSGRLPNPNLAFSAGLRMRKEHMRLSSMVITAPALSNSPQ